jgi:hypothetical protein
MINTSRAHHDLSYIQIYERQEEEKERRGLVGSSADTLVFLL